MASIRFLHTNDLHGKLSRARMPSLLAARAEADIYFDTGDCISAGNLAIPLALDPVWGFLKATNCTASVPGNRESHVLERIVQTKISGVQHPILCANWRKKDGSSQFQESLLLEMNGIKIGVFGVMVPMVTERMVSRHASQFIWEQPIPTARRMVEELRGHVDLLIALTHIGNTQDQKLAEACPEIDIIFGAHSHSVLEQPVRINNTWIAQGGSHGRYLGVYEWKDGILSGGLKQWKVADA